MTAGSGAHGTWPRIEFSVVCRNCPGDPRQFIGQRADHVVGVMVGRDQMADPLRQHAFLAIQMHQVNPSALDQQAPLVSIATFADT